jgi:hypothetical protein
MDTRICKDSCNSARRTRVRPPRFLSFDEATQILVFYHFANYAWRHRPRIYFRGGIDNLQ